MASIATIRREKGDAITALNTARLAIYAGVVLAAFSGITLLSGYEEVAVLAGVPAAVLLGIGITQSWSGSSTLKKAQEESRSPFFNQIGSD